MLRHIRKAKKSTTDRLHQYCCVRYPSYAAWHEHPYHSHTHWFLFFIFFIGWVMGLFFQAHLFPVRLAGAASYSWAQSSWSGGVTSNNANHTSNRTGWTEYTSKDAQLTASATVTLTQQSTTFTENFSTTTYKDAANTTADWQTANSRVQLDKTYFSDPTYVDITGNGTKVYVTGGYAYLAMGTTGLVIVNLSNTSNTYTRTFPTLSSPSARSVYVTGGYAYVALSYGGSSGALAIVNVSDPTNPGTPVYKTLNGIAYDVFVSGSYAYLAVNNAGLDIVDVSNPASPGTPVNKDTTDGCADAVIVSGSYAYVGTSTVGCTGSTNSTLEVFDVSAPTSPGNPVAKSGIEATRGRITLANNYVFIPTSSGIQSVNVTTPTSPGSIYTFSAPGVGRGAYASGNYVYLANNEGITIYDATDPTNLSLLSTKTLKTRGQDVFFVGNKAYVAYGLANSGDGLAIMDSTPSVYNTPRIVQSLAVDTATDPIALATLTATSTLNGQTITYQLSNDGGTTWNTVTSGIEYTFSTTGSDLRWKATLSTTDTTQTPTLSNISVNYKYYPASQVLTSSYFNTEASTTQLTQISWAETSPVPTGTNVRLQIRTAPDNAGSPGTWSDWLGPTSSSDYYETTPGGETVNSLQRTGNDDQWMQYRVYLTSTGANTQTVSNVTIAYNTFPATPSLSSSTHPSQTTFYPIPTSAITITAGTPTPAHYHYLVNQTASPNISDVGNGTQAPSNPFTVTIVSEGTWYVHVVAHDDSDVSSANFASYTIKYDPNAPTGTVLSFGSITPSSITVGASATDSGAGLHATPFYFERNSGTASYGWTAGNWTDSGLSTNTQYSYRVKARDATATPNESVLTTNQSKYTAANVPGSPSVTSPTATTLKVIVSQNSNPTGTAPAGDTEYALAASTDNFGTDTRFVQTNGTLSTTAVWKTYSQWGGASGITVTGLTTEQSYSFKVKARNGDALETSYGSATSAYTSPNAASNFHASSASATAVTVAVDRFVNDTVGQAGYYFSRGAFNSGWTTANSWTDTNVTANTSYTYSIKTRSSTGVESAPSTIDVTSAATAPTQPTLDSTRATDATLQLTLAASSNPASTEYAILETRQNKYVQTGGTLGSSEAWQTLTQWGTVTVSGLTQNQQYVFTVKARNSAGVATDMSDPSSGNTLALPSTPAVDNASIAQTSLTISFTGGSNPGTTTYALQEKNSGLYVQSNGALGGSATWQTIAQWGTVTVTGLTANTSYIFRAKARNDSGTETLFGGEVSAMTIAAGVPRAPTLSAPTTANILVTMNNTGADPLLEYAIFVTPQDGQGVYMQADGSLGNSAVWRTYSQWGGATGTTMIGLVPRKQYAVKIKSRDPNAGSVESSFGPTATITTAGGGSTDVTPPTLPTAINAFTGTDGKAHITWTDPTDADFSHVIVFRLVTDAPGGGITYPAIGKNVGAFIDTAAVQSGMTYQYSLRFEDTAGNSVTSRLFSVTIPGRGAGQGVQDTLNELSSTPTNPAQPTPQSRQHAESDINVKELIRVQYPSPASNGSATSACTGGQLVCSLNQLFSIERIPGFDFVIDHLVPSANRQENFRVRQPVLESSSQSSVTIIGRFGLLYNVVPVGTVAGATLAQPVIITLRYNPRDAVLVLRPEYTLTLAYLKTATNDWEIVADAVQDAVKGTFTASVSKAGTYGIVIAKTVSSQ